MVSEKEAAGISLTTLVLGLILGMFLGSFFGRGLEQQTAVRNGAAEHCIDPKTGETWLVYRGK